MFIHISLEVRSLIDKIHKMSTNGNRHICARTLQAPFADSFFRSRYDKRLACGCPLDEELIDFLVLQLAPEIFQAVVGFE